MPIHFSEIAFCFLPIHFLAGRCDRSDCGVHVFRWRSTLRIGLETKDTALRYGAHYRSLVRLARNNNSGRVNKAYGEACSGVDQFIKR